MRFFLAVVAAGLAVLPGIVWGEEPKAVNPELEAIQAECVKTCFDLGNATKEECEKFCKG